ncbi:MAG: RnfABCDGE type electron transport complex subunit B [Firmicutes bacterium]|nr:RnfABCDGE type electron transport complex subunit B [Bacillota bacterium]
MLIEILTPFLLLAGLGIVFGLCIGVVAKKFEVPQDPKFPLVRDVLPGANCGGCGYAGCDAFAKAVISGEASLSGCVVGGEAVAHKVAEILGVEEGHFEKKVAYVQCSGDTSHAHDKMRYDGVKHCLEASMVPGAGPKSCPYGCVGFGTCVSACKFGAIHVENRLAVVDESKCVGCGACVNVCPKNIIRLVPKRQTVRVQCSGQDRGKDVRLVCEAGCLGCTLCVRTCEAGAIKMEGNVARIDPAKCVLCGKCVAKCPAKVIHIIEN